MPFPIRGNNLAMVFMVLCWLVLFFSNNNWKSYLQIIGGNRSAVLMILFSLLFVFSSLIHFDTYSSLDFVLKNIEKRIHLLAFPFLLSGTVFLSQNRGKNLLMLFVYTIIFASILSLIMGLVVTMKDGTTVHINPLNGIVENNFRYHRLGSYIGIHAVFFAAYILFAFYILLFRYLTGRSEMKTGEQIIYLIGMVFMVLMIFLLQSIAISIILLLITTAVLLYHFYFRIKNKLALLVASIIIMLIGIVFSYNIYNKLDIKEHFFSYEMSTLPDRIGSGENNWNPLNIRLAIWENSLEVIQDHWLLGVGPGNMSDVLGTYYTKNNFSFGMLGNLDAHNQFLHTFINLGIAGAIVLLLLVISLAFNSIKNRNALLATLLMMFILFSSTASTLSVNKGIMFFSFFFIFLTYLGSSKVAVLND